MKPLLPAKPTWSKCLLQNTVGCFRVMSATQASLSSTLSADKPNQKPNISRKQRKTSICSRVGFLSSRDNSIGNCKMLAISITTSSRTWCSCSTRNLKARIEPISSLELVDWLQMTVTWLFPLWIWIQKTYWWEIIWWELPKLLQEQLPFQEQEQLPNLSQPKPIEWLQNST